MTKTATEIMIEQGLIVDVGHKELKCPAPGNLEYTDKGREVIKKNKHDK